MGENLRENIPPSSTDHEEATEGCGSELTRTNSNSSSISLYTSKDFSPHCADVGRGQSTEWTDEKHSLYLDSLEASFVDELYHSMQLGGSCSRKSFWGTYSSRELPDKTNNSGQFMVLQDGSWQNMNYEGEETSLETAEGSPCIHPITSLGKRHYVASPDPHEHKSYNGGIHLRGKLIDFSVSARSSKHKCQEDSVGSITEVSDQNFVDEDLGAKSSCKSVGKRLKTAADEASSSDQVVPSKFHTTDVSVADNTSSEREEQGHHELMSERPELFVCPDSDVHYFLRGS